MAIDGRWLGVIRWELLALLSIGCASSPVSTSKTPRIRHALPGPLDARPHLIIERLQGCADAHRVIFVEGRGLMVATVDHTKEQTQLLVSRVHEEACTEVFALDVLLPVSADLDLARPNGHPLTAVFENHEGAIASVHRQAEGGASLPTSRHGLHTVVRPRFLRGGSLGFTAARDPGVWIWPDDGGEPKLLCQSCESATGVETPRGRTFIGKRALSGRATAAGGPGHLGMLDEGETWRPVLEGRRVYDYDVALAEGGVVILAVEEENITVVFVDELGTETPVETIPVPAGLEVFSPTIRATRASYELAGLAVNEQGATVLVTASVPGRAAPSSTEAARG